ncbi:MAG: DUF4825 domain-containing protein [Clostridium sp.]
MKLKVFIPIVLFTLLTLIGCTSPSTESTNNTTKPLSTEAKSLIKYKNSYIGNATSVSQIVNLLPGNKFSSGISLQTSTKPYGLNVNYNANSKKDDYAKFWKDNNSNIVLEKNAVVMFSLIQNADYVEFNVDDASTTPLKFTRESLTKKYEKELTNLFKTNEDILKFLSNK